MKILISSDNHVGYLEKDPLRGSDSFDSFEEVLQTALQQKVDFVILGGDLFHANNPSRYTLYRTLEILKKYVLGDTPSALEYLSDKNVDFNGKDVNFEDSNINIQLPIFSIHGHHDEPSGQLGLASLDLIAATGLINYFGKQSKVDDVNISPILLKKNDIRLALYGLGNIRDPSLHRSFTLNKVGFVRPRNEKEYFNLMVLHQNRVAHSVKNYIPESFLDSFLDFVIWGHEHEYLL
jgi:double-strand break repair protein MRE11